MTVLVVYSDLDGTMLGPHGCFFRAEDTSLTLAPAEALLPLHAAGVALVLVSGRTRAQLTEAAQVFGADGFVGEMGAVLGWDGGRGGSVLTGALPPSLLAGGRSPYEAIWRTGAVDRLLARHAGRLEPHAPWHTGHEADVMLRGNVDVDAAEAELAAEGLAWLRLLDNGAISPVAGLGPSSLALDGAPPHVYHLMADGLGKGAGVAADLARRGLHADEAVAVGDSASDLASRRRGGTGVGPGSAVRPGARLAGRAGAALAAGRGGGTPVSPGRRAVRPGVAARGPPRHRRSVTARR